MLQRLSFRRILQWLWNNAPMLLCLFLDSGIDRRAKVCRADGLCQTAVQRVWNQGDLQRHRSDSHERWLYHFNVKSLCVYIYFVCEQTHYKLNLFCFFNADVPASGMYFMSYEWLKNILTPAGKRCVYSSSQYLQLFWKKNPKHNAVVSSLQP